ncbi:MAG: hypothetical protein JXA13_15930 [Anaerolineales bacterium]|nr:hypothetical protein [Anaerolineales bacterium]
MIKFVDRLRELPFYWLPVPVRLVLGLGGLVGIGTVLLLIPWVGAEEGLTLRDAFFTAASALTVTGLTTINPSVDMSFFGQLLLMALIQVGGLGYTVMAVLVFRLIGRKVSWHDRLALRDSIGLLSLDAVLELTQKAFLSIVGIEMLGAILLWVHWREMLGNGRAFFFACFHSISAFCNAGFDLFTGMQGYSGIPTDHWTLTIFAALIVIGGLGLPVITDLFQRWQQRASRRSLSLHTRLTLLCAFFLVLIGGVFLFIAETQPGGTLADVERRHALVVSFFQSISARTAGFNGIDRFEALTPPSQLLKLVLMFIGSAPVSMGGGITTGTFAVLMLALWSNARGRKQTTIMGRTIGQPTVRRASAILTISLVVMLISTWLLLISHPGTTLEQALFEVVSAFATCGQSLGLTNHLNTFGQVVIALVMIWGRLGALTVVSALAQFTPSGLVEYPEEQVYI